MSTPADRLDIESRVFSRYLTGHDPSEYVRSRYREGHHAIPYRRSGYDALDIMLTLVASKGPRRARMADAYARFFRPHGVLRQKLTLLLAVLENAPGTHRSLTRGGRGLAEALLAIAGGILAFGAALVAGMLLFGPMHPFLRGRRAPGQAVP